MKKLFLVDAYALIFKYYYAFLGRPMRNREGMNTSVVFGFVKFLRDIQKRERHDLLGVAFDPKGGSFRRDIFPEYKANRSETPEDILLSIPYVKRVLDAMCIPILEVAGYEADDVIGTLSQKGVEAGYDVYMVTPDKDYGQLVRDNCRIYKQRGAEGSIEIVDREAIREKYGIDDPQLVRDILALWGDASDNIPGVPGIGEKIACKLIQMLVLYFLFRICLLFLVLLLHKKVLILLLNILIVLNCIFLLILLMLHIQSLFCIHILICQICLVVLVVMVHQKILLLIYLFRLLHILLLINHILVLLHIFCH